jgi:tetratricopeptide (TPR) repeat protein
MPQHTRTKARHAGFAGVFSGDRLRTHWEKLHLGDREPYPDAARVLRLARSQARFADWVDGHGGARAVAAGVQGAWREFHAGHYARAIEAGQGLGALGATAANKAAAVHSLQHGVDESLLLRELEAATARGEQAVEMLPGYANAHYMLALVLGRYSQRISITRALAIGLATRVRTHLDATIDLEQRHAEAHIALGLYHAEIVAKLGSLLAALSYQASREAALQHFQRAIKLVPESPIAHIEYANGLLLLDASAYRDQARQHYERAAACEPVDAMEQMDVERARHRPV